MNKMINTVKPTDHRQSLPTLPWRRELEQENYECNYNHVSGRS